MSDDVRATNPQKARQLAERIGRLVIKQSPEDALAALQVNVARIFIEANDSKDSATVCAQVFGEQLAGNVEQNWHAKRGRH